MSPTVLPFEKVDVHLVIIEQRQTVYDEILKRKLRTVVVTEISVAETELELRLEGIKRRI